MEVLRDLLSIVTRNKLKHLRVIGQSSVNTQENKLDELYEYLISRKGCSDFDAAQLAYQSEPSDARYRKLKTTLTYRLVDLLFLIDSNQPKYQEHGTAFQHANKYLAAAQILMARSAWQAARHLFLKALDIAQANEFTDIALQCLKQLRNHYGLMEGDSRKYRKYDQQFKEALELQQAEIEVEEFYILLGRREFGRRGKRKKLHQQAVDICRKVDPLLERFDSARLHYHGRLLRVIRHMSDYNYRAAGEVCREALAFFESKPFRYRIGISSFTNNLLVCCTQLQQFDEGWRIFSNYSNLYPEGHFNWYNNRQMYLMLCMHTGRYQEAYQTFSQAVDHFRFSRLPARGREKWKIFEAYIHYLVAVGQVEPASTDTRFSKFRLGRFLNEVPVFSKDKRGYNIPILIAQTLFLILQKRYQNALDRVEALDKYCSRYLRKDVHFRSNCFIRMLMQVPISGFHRAAVERRAASYLEKLKSVPLEVADQPHEVEIIPYEELWTFVLASLELKFHRNRISKKIRGR